MKPLFVLALLVLAGCPRDPAHDRPIEPWASPISPPTAEDGGLPPAPAQD